MNDPCINLSETLRNEHGGAFEFVCIWREGVKGDAARKTTVGEFLSDPANFGGEWCIDGGWGLPPGPIIVRWHEESRSWVNGGFCGRLFSEEKIT